MRKKNLDRLVKLADWRATVSQRTWQKQIDLRDQALIEQENVQEYIATYDKAVAGDECVPVMLAHKRMFVSKLSDHLAQLGEHVVDCGLRIDDASVKLRSDTQKVAALRLLRDGESERANIKERRHEQGEQDEIGSRSQRADHQSSVQGGRDNV